MSASNVAKLSMGNGINVAGSKRLTGPATATSFSEIIDLRTVLQVGRKVIPTPSDRRAKDFLTK